MVLSAAFVFPSLADTNSVSETQDLPDTLQPPSDVNSALEKTLEYNFSPVDRARLRKALMDYARNNDPEHIQINRERQKMRKSLNERFTK